MVNSEFIVIQVIASITGSTQWQLILYQLKFMYVICRNKGSNEFTKWKILMDNGEWRMENGRLIIEIEM